MKKLIIAFISFLILCSSIQADTSVWKVSKNGAELYLGGTCHILRDSDYPLPEEFDQAYAKSEIIVFETDIGKMNTPEVQQMLLTKMVYADGTSLKDHLSAETYEMLNRVCDKNGIPLTSLNHFKPVMVMLPLAVMELKKLGIKEEGVEMLYYKRNLQDKKPVLKLETVEEQIDIISSMGAGNEDDFVRQSLDELDRIKEIYELIVNHWKKGKDEDLYRLYLEPEKRAYPEIYRKILKDRNDAWLPKIESFMATPEKEFVLVGFAHLVGEDGILEQLRKRGYQVKKY